MKVREQQWRSGAAACGSAASKDQMRQVGEVRHVELFTEGGDPYGRSKDGKCGVAIFPTDSEVSNTRGI